MKRNTVSDRDVLPVEVLENLMGWPTVARIWWPMWLQNRDEVIARILAEVDRAEADLDVSAPVAPAPVETPQPEPEPQSPVAEPMLADGPSPTAFASVGTAACR